MATNFPQTLGMQYDPYAELIAAQEAKLAKPQAPAYSPEEQAQRVAQNQREYELGMLGQLSGDQALGGVGGHVLKQAMAMRSPRVTEKGTADQLRGTFTYSPEYLREQDQNQLARFQQASAGAQQQKILAANAAAERADLARQRAEDQRALHAAIASNRTEPLVAVIGPDGAPVYLPRSQANGMRPAPTGGGGAAGEDERKAAGWFDQASLAFATMKDAMTKEPQAASPGYLEMGAKAVPKLGEDLSYMAQSPQRQRFTTAASSFSEAVLRAATGAGVTRDEAMQKVRELTPRFGESAEATADKEARASMYLGSLLKRAGRAAPQTGGASGGWGPSPAAGGDGWGIRPIVAPNPTHGGQ